MIAHIPLPSYWVSPAWYLESSLCITDGPIKPSKLTVKFQWYLFSLWTGISDCDSITLSLRIVPLLSQTFPDNLSSFHSPLSAQCELLKNICLFPTWKELEKKGEPFNRKSFKQLRLAYFNLFLRMTLKKSINIVNLEKYF